MLTALLAAVAVWSLLVGAFPAPVPVVTGGLLAVVLALHRHEHGAVLHLDHLARNSHWSKVNPMLKTMSCLLLLCLCLMARTVWPPLSLAIVLAVLSRAGGVRFWTYQALLAAPAAFLSVSALALVWTYSASDSGWISIRFGTGYLVIGAAAQATARLVTARALGAVSCLYFLSLSTPLPEVLEVLRRLHAPAVVVDLALLIYRYIFLLLATCETMRDAAASRLGFGGLRRSVRTTGIIYGNLLARSFRRAQACFDAMESRCCTGSIRFWTRPKPVRPMHAAVLCLLVGGMVAALVCGG